MQRLLFVVGCGSFFATEAQRARRIFIIRHCEERSDAAISNRLLHFTSLPRFARNDRNFSSIRDAINLSVPSVAKKQISPYPEARTLPPVSEMDTDAGAQHAGIASQSVIEVAEMDGLVKQGE